MPSCARRSARSGRRDEVLAEEQAALRRVATLVAQDVPSSELFCAVAREVGTLIGADFSGMIRYEDDESVTTVATWAAAGEHPPVPARWETEPGDPAMMIVAAREATRVDDWTSVPGSIAAVIRNVLGVSSSVGCPIVVEGRLWGALAVALQAEPAAAAGHRVADCAVHRPGRHRHRQRGVAREGGPAGGGAGRAAASRDARRARRATGGGVHGDRERDRASVRPGGDPDGALRRRPHRGRGGQLGSD